MNIITIIIIQIIINIGLNNVFRNQILVVASEVALRTFVSSAEFL